MPVHRTPSKLASPHNHFAQSNAALGRREFLKLSLAVAAHSFCTNRAYAEPESADKKSKILVLGAGIAGLAAAHALKQANYEVTVLEARQRIGGRIWTSPELGVPFDLGAMHFPSPDLEEETTEPWFDWINKLKPETQTIDYTDLSLFDHTGQSVAGRRTEQFLKDFQEIVDDARRAYADNPQISISTQKGVLQTMRQQLVSDEREWLFNWAMSWHEARLGLDLAKLSIHNSASNLLQIPSEETLRNGYESILRDLAAGLDIRFQQRITRIENLERGALVATEHGQFEAERVIVTLPAAVLRESPNLFTPELPAEKRDALKRIQVGIVNKVVLRFAEAFWPDDAVFGYTSKTAAEFPLWLNCQPLFSAPILAAVCTGEFARQLEAKPDEEIKTRILEIVDDCFGTHEPILEGMLVTRWGQDPFAGGTTVFAEKSSDREIFQTLSAPIGEHLLFAGDATHGKYPGTVLGAYLSGIREAKRILDEN